MPSNIFMPELSPGMEKAHLLKWLKKEGDSVHPGDVLAEVETDKAVIEIEAEHAGTLARIVVPAGTPDVPINQLIAVIAAEGEALDHLGDASPASEGSPSAPAPAPDPRMAPRGGRVFASPLARRIAKDAGIEIGSIKGSGPSSRIVERDVRGAIDRGTGTRARKLSTEDDVKGLFSPGSYEHIPHDDMRRTVARRLTAAVQAIPQFHVVLDCDAGALLALRERINVTRSKSRDGSPVHSISVTDMIVKAFAMAFTRIPEANATWTEDGMLRHKDVDVGVAVALPGSGLITPIVRKAQAKTLSTIADELKDLVRRAKDRKLKPEEYRGGTTAVSNLGMFGVKHFSAIVNPPHSTILAVGAARQCAVVKNGELAIGCVVSVTLTCDHRVVDGALGAKLLGTFKELIEKPEEMLV